MLSGSAQIQFKRPAAQVSIGLAPIAGSVPWQAQLRDSREILAEADAWMYTEQLVLTDSKILI